MSTVSKLFRSTYGFVSPYFIVDAEGNLISQTITVTGNRIELTNGSYISYNGQPLLTSTSLSESITSIPGTLTSLTVNGPTNITGNFSVSNGSAVINPSIPGSLDNLTIGQVSAKPGKFTTLTVTSTGSIDLSPTGLVKINPIGPVTISSSGSVTSIVLNASATGLQLGGSRTSVSSSWSIAGGRVTLSSTGLPYHSYNKSGSSTPSAQNYNNNFILRAGTNVAGAAQTITPGLVGYSLNGIAIYTSSTNDPPVGYSIPASGWNYNAAYSSASALGYDYKHDNAGGRTTTNRYVYSDYSFATAWSTGTGHGTGSTTATGVAEVNYIPYLSGSLLHSDGHSKIIGFALDGYPIYGPYGYSTAINRYSAVKRMVSGFQLNAQRLGFNAQPVSPQYPLGIFTQDYTYVGNGDLDDHNGRYCVTPDYPNGTYAYFATIDENGNPVYPYIVGTSFYGNVGTAGSGSGVGPTAISGGTITISPSGTLTLGTNAQTTALVGNISIASQQSVSITPSGTGVLIINPNTTGNMNNVIIGASTPRTGTFTTASLTTPDENFNSNRSQVSTKRYAELNAIAFMFFSMN